MPRIADPPFVVSPHCHRVYVDPADARGAELLRFVGSFGESTRRLWQATLALDIWTVVVDVGGQLRRDAPVDGAARRGAAGELRAQPTRASEPAALAEESGLAVDLREVAAGCHGLVVSDERIAVW